MGSYVFYHQEDLLKTAQQNAKYVNEGQVKRNATSILQGPFSSTPTAFKGISVTGFILESSLLPHK